MFVVMGGTGHVGSGVVGALLSRGAEAIIVTRNPDKAAYWSGKGARVAEADISDPASLRKAFRLGRRAFLLNPPADPAQDTDAVELGTVANILAALEGSGLEKVVAASTGGARPGECLGDLNTLWALEEGLRRQGIPAAINRGAYYMSNWDGMLEPVRTTGKLPTMYPAQLPIPMVAPGDLGQAAADRLMSGTEDVGVKHIEGPARYSSVDVADCFARALGRPVEVVVTRREQWHDTFMQLCFSEAAARSYARMIATTINDGFDMPDSSVHCETTLETYISQLASAA